MGSRGRGVVGQNADVAVLGDAPMMSGDDDLPSCGSLDTCE